MANLRGIQHMTNTGSKYDPFSSVLRTMKSFGILGSSIGLFMLLAIVSFFFGFELLALMSIFYIISIIVRIPDTYSDISVESIATFSLILAIIGGMPVAAFFAFTATWLGRFTSPYGPVEEVNETISESLSILVPAILSPVLISISGSNLILYMVYFQIVRSIFYQVFMLITSPATVMIDIFYTSINFVLNMLQSYVILLLFGNLILGYAGVSGWSIFAFDFSRFRS
jgi:hypothetical protein